jgi:hypothetical protein
MNPLGALQRLLGKKDQQRGLAPAAKRLAPAPRAWEDGSGVNMGRINPMQRGAGIPLQTRGRYEDSQMVQGAQGLVPMSADVANFNTRSMLPQADEQSGLNPQGFSYGLGWRNPMSSQQLQPAPQTRWQNVGVPPRPNMINPQIDNDGYFWN